MRQKGINPQIGIPGIAIVPLAALPGSLSGGSGVSLSERIRQLLTQAIETGVYAPGSHLPTERELAARYDVSLAPVRIALGELVKAGMIERTQGRGTFVRQLPVTVELSFRPNITSTMARTGLAYSVTLVNITVIDGPLDMLEKLGLARSAKVLHLLRYLTVEQRCVAILRSWLPAKRFKRLIGDEKLRAGGSLYEALKLRFDVDARNLEARLVVAHADELVSAMMGVPFGTPTMQVSTIAADQAGEIVEVGIVNYDATRFAFNLRTP